MRQMVVSRDDAKFSKLTLREQLVIIEIGFDKINSASSFVEYISESYGFSKSSVWYNLNRLKEKGMLDFATREEIGKALELTTTGASEFSMLEKSQKDIGEIFTAVGAHADKEYKHTSSRYGLRGEHEMLFSI